MPITRTERVRARVARLMSQAGHLGAQMGLHPDTITIAGLLLVAVASVLLALGQFTAAGVVLLIGLPLDALDGAVARAMQRSDRFGALLDSTLDRYADAFIFAALGYYSAVQGRMEMLLLAFAALIGSYTVSYVRARAEGMGISVTIGLFSRLERLMVILVMVFLPATFLPLGLLILALGTNLTALQRLWFVYRTLRNREV